MSTVLTLHLAGADPRPVLPTLAGPFLSPVVVDPADLPDLDRPLVPGLTWYAPLEERPIVLIDHAEVRPVLALNAGRFWDGARHGLAVGRAKARMDAAVLAYGLASSLAASPHLAIRVAETAGEWTGALDTATREFAACLGVTA